jgi:hypothetical protein
MYLVLSRVDGADQRPLKRKALVRMSADVEDIVEGAAIRPMPRNALRHVEAGTDIDNLAVEHQQVDANVRDVRVAPSLRWL